MSAGSVLDFTAQLRHGTDAWLWRRGFHNPHIRAVTLVQIMGSLLAFTVGIIFFIFSSWIFWFSTGFAMHGLNFFFLAKQIMAMNLNAYSRAMLGVLLLSFSARLFLTALALYFVLIVCHAPVSAIAGGLIAAVSVALGTYALAYFRA